MGQDLNIRVQLQLYNFMSLEEANNNAPFSLIKYEAEIQISDNLEQYEKAKNNQKVLDSKPSPEDVLNNMIPPRDWKSSEGKHYMQYVSHQKSERDDVVRLKDSLDRALQHRQARTQGICPIREQLFSHSFDQIIRQVTINCPERGLLLMRVRDEHKMTLAAYQTLYQSSVSFGMQKLQEAEEGMDQLTEYLDGCQEQKNKLQNKKIELISKKESLEKKIAERKEQQALQKEESLIQIQQQENALAKFLNSLKEARE